MSNNRKQSAATAAFGYAGVSGGALLRHDALADAYGERHFTPEMPSKRPMLGAERKLLRHAKGRGRYAAGLTLATVSAPAAAKGTHDLLYKRRTFVEDGVSGLSQSFREKQSNDRRAPNKLVAGNYAAGTVTGAATGGATQLLLRHRKIGGGTKAVLASNAAVLAGVSSLPVQRKIIEHRTKGAFTATPTGIRRVPKPVNHGATHGSRVEKKDAVTGMSRREELQAIKRKQRTATINAATSLGGVASLGLLGAAALPGMKHRGKLVRTASTVGTASAGVGAFNGLEGARLARRDLKAREQVLASKAVIPPDKDILTLWGGNGSWKALSRGAARHPSNERWRLSAERGRAKNKAKSRRVVPMGIDPRDYYERQYGRVIKSYVGNGKWVPASQIPKDVQRLYRTSRSSPAHHRPVVRAGAKGRTGRTIWSQPTRQLGARVERGALPDTSSNAGEAQANGLSGGRMYIRNSHKDDPHVIAHEMAHLKPKRNPHRMQERMRSPLSRGREEGRADFMAYKKVTRGYYKTPGTDIDARTAFRAGYDEVQSKMNAARQARGVGKAFGMPRVPRVRRGFLRQTRTATGLATSTVRGGLIR